jgi:hypothetical protein
MNALSTISSVTLRRARPACAAAAALALSAGCATQRIETAREQFYAGRLEQAAETLDRVRVPEKNRVLLLMERGTVRQARGEYADSSRDFIEAADLAEELRIYSVSKGAASFVANDSVQNFRGAPFERTLLHSFTAMDHLASTNWEHAAVEARRIIHSLEPAQRGKYPEDAYSRYMAGFCLEMVGDPSNAALQYRNADSLLPGVKIGDADGRLAAEAQAPEASAVASNAWRRESLSSPQTEMVCFVLAGRSPRGCEMVSGWQPRAGDPVYGEIHAGGRRLGRSYTLADTADLAWQTARQETVRKTAKTVARVVLKESIALAAATQDEDLGRLVELVLVGLLEQPDVRRWETLPRWLGVARVPCPPELREFEVVLRRESGRVLKTIRVDRPLARSGNVFVSFCRDVPP